MSSEQTWMVVAGAVALVLLLLLLAALWRTVTGLRAEVGEARAEARDLAERLAGAEASRERPAAEIETAPASYLITGIDQPAPALEVQVVDRRLFADIVARESVIKAASLAHGVRRALRPETRHRIRFEIKREVKRSRKQRRTDLKAALRDLQARQRAELRDEGDAA